MSRRWTEEQNAYFAKLWDEGHAPAKIGNLMAEIGRPICGQTVKDRAYRLGLPKREADQYRHINAWSKEARGLISELWGLGFSANQIACKVSHLREGSVTRNMIIGVVTRMNLPRRAPAPPKFTKPKKKAILGTSRKVSETAGRTQLVKKPVPLKPVPVKPVDADRIGPTLFDLKPRSCRWPVGTKTGEQQMFCGGDADTGSSYCCEHRKRSASQMSKAQREALSEGMRKHQKSKRSLKDIIAREAA
jgi:hypothetical protein